MTTRPLAAAVALLMLAGCTSSDPEPSASASPSADATQTPTENANRPAPAEPAVEVAGDCTPEPLEDADGRYVAADLKVTNTGNIGTRARISVVWPAEGSRLSRARTVRLRPGRSRSIELRLALTADDAAAIAAAVDAGRECRINSRVTGAFGAPED